MKNPNLFLSIFLFFVFLSINSFAQVRVGIKGGVNIPSIHVVDQNDVMMDGFNPIASFHIGAYSDIFLSEKISLLLEVQYSVKGAKNNTDFSTPDFPINLVSRLRYLSFPVLFNYHLKDISFEIGPEFNYKVSTKTKVNNKKPIIEIWNPKFDIGIDFGIKYHLEKWNLGVRYSHGFNDISDFFFSDFNGNTTDDPTKYLNRLVQLSVGFDLLQKKSSKTEDE